VGHTIARLFLFLFPRSLVPVLKVFLCGRTLVPLFVWPVPYVPIGIPIPWNIHFRFSSAVVNWESSLLTSFLPPSGTDQMNEFYSRASPPVSDIPRPCFLLFRGRLSISHSGNNAIFAATGQTIRPSLIRSVQSEFGTLFLRPQGLPRYPFES